jgi:hypothetical protein
MTEEIKEDFLEVDPKIPGQNYVCLSFVSPEKMIKQKEVFFMTKFLDYIINDKELIATDVREKMMSKDITIDYENVIKLYEDWKYLKTEELESIFFEQNEYRTTMRGLKVRGVYDTHKEASVRAQILRRKDPSFNVFVGQVGYWLPWDPECESVPEQEYQEGQLNELVKKYKDNLEGRDNLYDQMKNERIEKAKKEVNAKKELLKAQKLAEEATVETTEETVSTNQEEASPITQVDEEESIKNIEKLRSIVDESDKLYYDNLKKTEHSLPIPPDNSQEKSDEINNFKSESMENLESSDPWLERKNT